MPPTTTNNTITLHTTTQLQLETLARQLKPRAEKAPEALVGPEILTSARHLLRDTRRVVSRLPVVRHVRLPACDQISNADLIHLLTQARSALRTFENTFFVWNDDTGTREWQIYSPPGKRRGRMDPRVKPEDDKVQVDGAE